MPILMIARFAEASLAIHVTAEDHWLAHGEIPVTVILITACGAPEAVELPRGRGPQAGAEAVRAHAERLGAVALVATAPAATTGVRQGADVFARTPLADPPTAEQAPGHGRCILTVAYRPERDLVKALSTGVRTHPDGARTPARRLESDPAAPPGVDRLDRLPPPSGRAEGGEAR